MQRQQREGALNIRHPHEVALLEQPAYLPIRVQLVLEPRIVSSIVQARLGVVVSQPLLLQLDTVQELGGRTHRELDVVFERPLQQAFGTRIC